MNFCGQRHNLKFKSHDENVRFRLKTFVFGWKVQVKLRKPVVPFVGRRLKSRLELETVDKAVVPCRNKTRSPAIAEGPRDAGVPVEIW